MPGEAYEAGGTTRGIRELFAGTKELALEGVRNVVLFGEAVERRGSTLPLLRRFSQRSSIVEYEAIPLGRPGAVSPA